MNLKKWIIEKLNPSQWVVQYEFQRETQLSVWKVELTLVTSYRKEQHSITGRTRWMERPYAGKTWRPVQEL